MNLPPHRHKKRLGQHFLHDALVLQRIVRAIDPRPGQRVVEIGPGAGALTLPLLQELGELTVIEFDRDLLPALRELAVGVGRLEIIQADVLAVDLERLAAGSAIRLVGNLPYNISSPILFHCIEHIAAIADMHFMLQKEVVERMAAQPGGKDYGRLSVMLQLACRVEPLLEVPPDAFHPPPKVDSAVVRLTPLPAEQRAAAGQPAVARVVKAAFAQRRKTLANALHGLLTPDDLRNAHIDPGLRAERLTPHDFVRLAAALPEAAADPARESAPRLTNPPRAAVIRAPPRPPPGRMQHTWPGSSVGRAED